MSEEAEACLRSGEFDMERILSFQSRLTLDEIEANFKDVNVGDGIIAALQEVLSDLLKNKQEHST